jgi:hypothetical protein
MDISERLYNLSVLISRGRYRLGDEKACQEDMANFLIAQGVPFYREHQLSDGIVDFYLPRSRIGIEVKVSKQWGKMDVYRQCERYCEDPSVDALLLATASAQRLPELINQKPARVLLLSQTAL